MGIDIDNFSFEEAVDKGMELIHSGKPAQVITINPEMFDEAKKNFSFKTAIDNAEMVIADGIGIKLALKLRGKNINRIAGIDFAYELVRKCAEKNEKIAIVGSKEQVITKAVQKLRESFQNINIVYYHNGYFDNSDLIYNELKSSEPNLILVALGSPKQELFIYNAKNLLHPCLMVGIGGSLDVWSGEVKRAPKIYQKLGIEWLYRTVTQPERFKRIFPALPLFLLKSLTYKKDKKC